MGANEQASGQECLSLCVGEGEVSELVSRYVCVCSCVRARGSVCSRQCVRQCMNAYLSLRVRVCDFFYIYVLLNNCHSNIDYF